MLLVPLCFRSSCQSVLPCITNFGSGALAPRPGTEALLIPASSPAPCGYYRARTGETSGVNRMRLRFIRRAMVLLGALTVIGVEPAMAYPDRPVRIVVPFAPGGLNDTVARLIQPYLERSLGQPVIVDNRPGASGIIGADAVAKAPPDGHMLLMVASSYTVIPATNSKVPYDSARDLQPIAMVGKNPLLFVVAGKLAAKTLPEFVALAKASPGKLNYASPGAASQNHLVIELFS